MLDNQIGPAFMIALGLMLVVCGVGRIAGAYHIASFDAWTAMVLPAAGAVVLGALLAWGGYRIDVSTAAVALDASRVKVAPVTAH